MRHLFIQRIKAYISVPLYCQTSSVSVGTEMQARIFTFKLELFLLYQ